MKQPLKSNGQLIGKFQSNTSGGTTLELNSRTTFNVCVVGGGFVGLVAAAGFAEFGHSVVCVENNPERLAQLRDGMIPFFEKDLDDLVEKNVSEGRLTFAGDLTDSVENQDIIFLAVGTPPGKDGRADISALESVAETLLRSAKSGQIVVLKSTVPVGTGSRIQSILKPNDSDDTGIAVINNPEFLREGSAVQDFFEPHRIVIGGADKTALDKVTHLYRVGMTKPVPIVITNNETAEMIKYASNAFLAMKVGFVNELAGLCDCAGINVLDVARTMGMDSRIGSEFLNPGPGWGGSCFRKDLQEFTGLAKEHEYPIEITTAVLRANRQHHLLIVEKVRELVGDLDGKRIGILGLSFKADTSDMRDSPAIPIVTKLLEAGATVVAYDPQAHREATTLLPDINLADSVESAVDGTDCVVILTEWKEFQLLDLKLLASKMQKPNLVDSRNLLVPETVRKYGIRYIGMGQR